MRFKLGLTGSIGMGKSTTAQLFVEQGCDLWDADAAVHRLYAPGGPAIAPIAVLVPDAVQGNQLNRESLRRAIRADEHLLGRIEQIVHPLLAEDRERFISGSSKDILVFDIPLLFETGGNKGMDAVACVWIDAETQKARVMARGTMTEDDFEMILSRQLPIADKLAQSDYKIETDTPGHARVQVAAIVKKIRSKLADA